MVILQGKDLFYYQSKVYQYVWPALMFKAKLPVYIEKVVQLFIHLDKLNVFKNAISEST